MIRSLLETGYRGIRDEGLSDRASDRGLHGNSRAVLSNRLDVEESRLGNKLVIK
jgi:hypothetical protein